MGSGGSKKERVPEQAQREVAVTVKQENKALKPSGDFPNPASLRKAQKEYAKANVQVEKQNGVPVPHPPPNSSRELLAKQDFTAIDKIASGSRALEYSEEDYKTLSNYLCSSARNDVEKVRAFFVFIASQGPQQVFKYLKNRFPNKQSPLLAMLTIVSKNLNGLYNEILVNLCKSAGIPVIQERTDVKGVSYRVGHPVGRWGNTICLVFVDGAWRMIDQHWGSESVSADPDDEWILVEDQGATKTLSQTQKQYFHEVKEFYFLTDPVDMVYSHWCETTERQLLARPLSKNEFDEIAYLNEGFFSFGMGDISHAKCVVKCDDGTVKFKFGLDKTRKFKFFHNVYKSALDRKTDRFKGREPKDFSRKFSNADGSKMNITIDFPWIGKYKLVVEGMEVGQPYRKGICEYLINVTTPNHGAEPIPSLPSNQDELGITGVVRSLGIETTIDGGVVHAKNGIARLEFRLPENNPFNFRPVLVKQNGPDSNVADNQSIVRHYIVNEKLVVYVELESLEQRLLRINLSKNNREERMVYLVIPDVQSPSWTKNYPQSLERGGKVGNLTEDDAPQLTPISHLEPVLEAPSNGHTTVEMKQTDDVDLKIESTLLYHSFTSSDQEDMSDYLFHEQDQDKHNFSLRFTKVGVYALNIFSQTSKTNLYQYIFNVLSPDTSALPFPVIQKGWRAGVKVNEPRQGELNENSNVQFNIVIPGAKRVQLEGKNKKIDLEKGKDDEWIGQVSTDDDTPELKISAELEDDFTDVLLYQVLSEEQQEEKVAAQEKLVALTEQEKQKLENREDKAQKEADNKKKQKEAEVQQAKEDFENNREKYEAREQQLENEAEKEQEVQPEEPDYTKINLEKEMDDDDLQKQIERKKKETEEGWKELYGEKSKKIAVERLKAAMSRRDLQEMIKSLAICEKKQINDELMGKARILIDAGHEKQNLREVMEEEDIDGIKLQIDKICSRKHIHSHLKQDVIQAQLLLDRLRRANRTNQRILDLDAKTMSELRRYNNPPQEVHNVLKAALLILGEDEGTTEEWKGVQKQLNPTGKNGLNRRIMGFDQSKLNLELAARSSQILSEIDYTHLKNQSAGASIFYIWSMGVLQEADIGSDIQPPDLERQREILGRLTPPTPRKRLSIYEKMARKAEKEAKQQKDKENIEHTE